MSAMITFTLDKGGPVFINPRLVTHVKNAPIADRVEVHVQGSEPVIVRGASSDVSAEIDKALAR